ncbi:hypothetical protein [Haloglomus litoreum]|uniref:hypothetical protein n=1 Tax=Haloglomus litoreum TaxID=3034026 RepID=UPI0023E79FD9|nr:hypothetical protein [Haloglomus sp. DT116]
MRRRHALACLAGGLAGLAGCSVHGESDTDSPTGATPGAADATRPRLALRSARVQEAVFTFDTGTPGLLREPGSQYLVVQLARGEARTLSPTIYVDGRPVPDDRVRRLVRPVGGDERFVARVPVQPVERASVAVRGERIPIPLGTAAALANRPRFRLRDVTVTARGDGSAIEVTVANEGDREGVWRAVVVPWSVADGGEPFELCVPVTGERTGTVALVDQPPGDVTVTSEVSPDARGIAYRVDAATGTPTGS